MILVIGMFPGFLTMIAIYFVLKNLGLIGNPIGLILVNIASSAMNYYIVKGFFDTIPKALDEAAFLDGATKWQVFTKITVPLSKPIIVYTALTQFAWPWSDFILPNLLLKNKDLWTVAVGLTHLGETEFTRFAAGSVFIAVPIVILYFALSRFLVTGVSSGAVKE